MWSMRWALTQTGGWPSVFPRTKKWWAAWHFIFMSPLDLNKYSRHSGWLFPQGGDDVMGCVHDDNGRVRIHHFYNVGQWAKEIKRNPARDEEGIFENNRVTCRFKRPLYVPREETLVDLHLSWYYLFAWGPAIQGDPSVFMSSFFFIHKTSLCPSWSFATGSITRHDIDSPPVSDHMISIYKYEDIFMPSTAYQTFNSPLCLLFIVALTFYLLMGTP